MEWLNTRSRRPGIGWAYIATILMLTLLTSCGSAPKRTAFRDVKSQIPALAAGKARLYFYNAQPTDAFHELIFKVFVDNIEVARINPFNANVYDVPEGRHIVSADSNAILTLKADSLTLNLKSGETRYIQVEAIVTSRLPWQPPYRINLMDSDQALVDLEKCWYVGNLLSN